MQHSLSMAELKQQHTQAFSSKRTKILYYCISRSEELKQSIWMQYRTFQTFIKKHTTTNWKKCHTLSTMGLMTTEEKGKITKKIQTLHNVSCKKKIYLIYKTPQMVRVNSPTKHNLFSNVNTLLFLLHSLFACSIL